jgi:hypothetical protein
VPSSRPQKMGQGHSKALAYSLLLLLILVLGNLLRWKHRALVCFLYLAASGHPRYLASISKLVLSSHSHRWRGSTQKPIFHTTQHAAPVQCDWSHPQLAMERNFMRICSLERCKCLASLGIYFELEKCAQVFPCATSQLQGS